MRRSGLDLDPSASSSPIIIVRTTDSRDAVCSMRWRCCPSRCPGSCSRSATWRCRSSWPFSPSAPLEFVLDVLGADPNPVGAAHHRLRGPSSAVRRPRDGGRTRADVGRAGGGGPEPRRRDVFRAVRTHHPAPHHGQPHRGRIARVQLRDARSVRLAHPRPAARRTSRSRRRSTSSSSVWATVSTSPAPWASGAWGCSR